MLKWANNGVIYSSLLNHWDQEIIVITKLDINKLKSFSIFRISDLTFENSAKKINTSILPCAWLEFLGQIVSNSIESFV